MPPFTDVRSLDFEDHPFAIQRFRDPCALCGATDVYLDEIITDDRGGRMFVCSDTDHCSTRRGRQPCPCSLPERRCPVAAGGKRG